MRKPLLLALLAATMLAGGCSSASNPAAAQRPEIVLDQLVGPADLGYPGGRLDIQYQMSVINHAPTAIRLRRLDISSVGGGAYFLRREALPFDELIEPEHRATVTFWVHALQAGSFGRGSNEPVTIRGIVYFDGTAGRFQQIFMRDLSQFAQ